MGTRAEVVAGVSPDGDLAALVPSSGVVVFLTSSCLACRDVWGALGDGRASGLQVAAVVTPDAAMENVRAVRKLAPPAVPVVMSSAAWHAYGVSVSPWVVVVIGGLVVAEGRADGWEAMAAIARGRSDR